MRPQQKFQLSCALGVGMLLLATGCTSNYGDETKGNYAPVTSSPVSASAESSATQQSSMGPGSEAPRRATLTLFYVAVGDAGKSGPEIGCGDSLVATETGPEEFVNQIEAAMMALLAEDDAELGESGLRNALAASELRYLSSQVDDDVVSVELSGTISSGGSCDTPRMIEQLRYTAMTAAGTSDAKIFVDGKVIEEVLSVK